MSLGCAGLMRVGRDDEWDKVGDDGDAQRNPKLSSR